MPISEKKLDYESDSDASSTPSEENINSSEEDDSSQKSGETKQVDLSTTTVSDGDKNDNKKNLGTKQHSLTFVCNALSDYSSKEAGELSFEKGEMLTITNIREDGWWDAKNNDGIQGLAPSTFLKVPDHVDALIKETLQRSDSKQTELWSNLRSSIRKVRAHNIAVRTFGSIGFPFGFCECMLGTLLKEAKSYSTEAFFIPKLSDSGLSFEDIKWEGSPASLKPITTVLQKVIQIVALRQIIQPPTEYEITSRHVHMCLHDGNKVLSNIHTTKANWDSKNPKIWMFGTKIAVDGSCLEEGQVFVRSNKSFATLGILFELCVTYKKMETSEISEMSCGWAFMRLLNDSGVPVKSKTKILKVHNSVPFTNYLDATSNSLSSLQKLMNRRKQPRMVVSVSSPKRSSTQQICYLPSTIIGPVSSIPLMALFRKIIANDLLQKASFDNADLIQSPFLSNFPRVFTEPDLTDFCRIAWAERLKQDKRDGLKIENKKLNEFCKFFMETTFLVMNSCNLPPYVLGNMAYEQERKMKLLKVMNSVKAKEQGILALSTDLEFKPISDKENKRLNIENIFSSDPVTCLEGVTQLKNWVIGSNKSKGLVIKLGAIPRLFQILLDKDSSDQLLIEAAVAVGSLARGSDNHVQELLNEGLLNVVLRGLASPQPKLMEACLRCLRTVLSRKDAPIDVLYNDPSLVPHLVLMAKERSSSVQECVMTMLYCGCQTPEHQDILCENGVLDLFAPLLCCNIYRVQIPSLKCLAQMCYQNDKVSELAASSSFDGKSVPDILVSLMSRDKTTEMQLASAKCMTYMFRSGALMADDSRIVYKALPTLVRMCQKDVNPEDRVDGAETLAYLTEVDTELQRIASISDHLIPTLSELLKFRTPNLNGSEPMDDNDSSKGDYPKVAQEIKMAQEMKQAAFKAFSSLAANDEEIRKKIIDTDTLMENVVSAFSDPSQRVRLAAVRCLHSLSRSVQQLRTTFQDHAVWRPLMKLLHNADDDILTVASSTLCNLLLEFSPSKEPILECGAVELLCGLTRREDPSLRLNGVWALMNMAFQADHKIKAQILTALGSEHVFRLLSDSDVDVLMKTLGLLRNLLSTKPVSGHIDHIMGLHGKQVMQAIVLILEGDHNAEVKEQALCILANIADGDFAKNFIMSNEDVLKKLTTYMMHSNVKLQIAATFCVSNLVWKEEEGALERQAKLKELGVQQLLQQLLSTTDTTLFDRVKTALHQFPTQGT